MTSAAIIDCAAFSWLGKILSSLVACATVTAIRDYNARSGQVPRVLKLAGAELCCVTDG